MGNLQKSGQIFDLEPDGKQKRKGRARKDFGIDACPWKSLETW